MSNTTDKQNQGQFKETMTQPWSAVSSVGSAHRQPNICQGSFKEENVFVEGYTECQGQHEKAPKYCKWSMGAAARLGREVELLLLPRRRQEKWDMASPRETIGLCFSGVGGDDHVFPGTISAVTEWK